MAITLLERQTLGFDPETNCVCGSDYCQPFLTTDDFNLYAIGSFMQAANILIDGPFDTVLAPGGTNDYWDLDANWSIGTSKLIGADPNAGSQAVYRPKIGLVAGMVYAITVNVTLTGTEVLGNGILITVNGDNLIYPDLVNGTGNYLPDGYAANVSFNYTWFYIPTSVTSDDLIISRVNDTGTLTIEVNSFRIVKMSVPALAFYDLEGNEIYNDTTFAGDITRELLTEDFNGDLSNPEWSNASFLSSAFTSNNRYFPAVSTPNLNLLYKFAITAGDFAGYTGCGTLRIYDHALMQNFVKNGQFTTTLAGWTAGDGWSWISGHANFDAMDGFPPAADGYLEQPIGLQGGYIYTLSFLLSNVSGSATVEYDIDGDTIIIAENLALGGTMSYDIDLTGYSGSKTILLRFRKGFNVFSNFDIDNVVFGVGYPDTDNESNCMNIQETQSCTLLFEGENSDSAFTASVNVLGYTYNDTGETKMIRLYAKKKYSGYPEEKDIFEFSDNSNRIMFAQAQKEFEVNVGDAAEHAHDLLSILRLHDTFTIDAVEYIPSSDYELRTRKTSDNSQAVFLVKEKTGISSNYSCS